MKPHGGRLSRSICRADDGERICRDASADTGNRHLGRAPREKIFQPFYSTKLSRGRHRSRPFDHLRASSTGTVARSERDQHSRATERSFVVELPLAWAQAFFRPGLFRISRVKTAMMNVLIVDDEEVLQDVLTSAATQAKAMTTFSARSNGEEDALTTAPTTKRSISSCSTSCFPACRGQEVLQARSVRRASRAGRGGDHRLLVDRGGDRPRCATGAFHYIPKPFKNEEVLLTVRKGLDQRRAVKQENRVAQERSSSTAVRIRSTSSANRSRCRQVFELIRRAAPSKSNILVLGRAAVRARSWSPRRSTSTPVGPTVLS